MGFYVDQVLFQASQSDADIDEDFSFLQPLDLITKDVNELRQIIKEKKSNMHKDREKDKDKEKEKDKEFERDHERERSRVREKERHEREKEIEKDRERVEREKERDKQNGDMTDRRMAIDSDDKHITKHEENGISEGESISIYLCFFVS